MHVLSSAVGAPDRKTNEEQGSISEEFLKNIIILNSGY